MPTRRIHKERPDDLVRLHVAEPAPLGLFGLAMGCLLLMMVDFEVTAGKLMMIPWVFLLPATLQLIAGFFDFCRHNVFGGTAFVGYAAFWYGLSWVYYWEIEYASNENIDTLLPQPTIRQHTGVISWGYLIFSIILSIISCGINRTFLSILLSIDFTFLMLILHTFHHEAVPAYVVGIGLIFVFLTSIYGFIAVLILKVAGGEVLPIGRPFFPWSNLIMMDKSMINLRSRSKIKEKSDDEDDDDDFIDALKSKSTSIHHRSTSSMKSLSPSFKQRSKKSKRKNNDYYVPMGTIKTNSKLHIETVEQGDGGDL